MMNRKDVIVTIGRQTGSGGKEIGKKLAEKLGVKCYDKEILAMTAKEGGFDEKVVESLDEKPTGSFLYSLYMGAASMNFSAGGPLVDLPLDHRIFLAQFEAIRKIADSGSCVIVGRCADYALEERGNLLSVFILGKEEDRYARIAGKQGLTRENARETVIKGDRKRSSYYNYYANRKWGASDNYDLCLNSSVFGIDGCVELILAAIDSRL